MGFFSKIGAKIKEGIQKIFKPKAKAPAPSPAPAEPISIEKQKKKRASGEESEALRRAVEMVIEANRHPGDATWEQARQAALVYIDKSQKLADKGPTQSGNRAFIAGKYLEKEISSPEGVEARKQRKLDIFNTNFGFHLSEEEADTVGALMESDSFKKLMETYKERYDILIGMVGDQVENGIDPVRIQRALDLWQRVGIEPDFSVFADVTVLDADSYNQLEEDLYNYNEETINADDFERQQSIEGILGWYLPW